MKKFWIRIGILILILELAAAGYLWLRGHVELKTENITFTESAKKLNNPERGFYYIYGFRIKDYEEDYEALVNEKMKNDTDTKLAMIQINLRNYREGEISQYGLQHIDDLFCALEKIDKKYIVRFLYDWDGENMLTEPESIDIILKHMEQIAPIINQYQHKIYMLQGLFTGNWGEMNGTRYSSQEDMKRLAEHLSNVTDERMYLSVRMPAQWRMCMETVELGEVDDKNTIRMGLYNDAIMGNEGDYGTYWTEGVVVTSIYGMKDRVSELEFQNELCKYVPNGGEVIAPNPLNDFENAKDTLQKMRVSYLNRDYDKNVLDKWANSVVEEEGIYYGMSGLDYMERHMGYRFLIDSTQMSYDLKEDTLSVRVTVKNVGFAPIYHDKKLLLIVCDKDGEVIHTSSFEGDIQTLYGGADADKELKLEQTIPVFGWNSSEYNVYFSIQDEYSNEMIQLANEQKMEKHGYKIGTVTGGIR